MPGSGPFRFDRGGVSHGVIHRSGGQIIDSGARRLGESPALVTAVRERNRSKVGRMAQLKGAVETATPRPTPINYAEKANWPISGSDQQTLAVAHSASTPLECAKLRPGGPPTLVLPILATTKLAV